MNIIIFFLIIPLLSNHTALYAHNTALTDDIHRYMWAEYQRFGGNGKEAYTWYKELLSSNPSPHAYTGYIHFLAQTGNFSKIIPLYDKHSAIFTHDAPLQLIFVQALEAVGRQDEADTLLSSLVSRFKKNTKIALYAAQMQLRNKNLTAALSIINNYLNSAPNTPNNYIFHFLKSQIYTQKNETQHALKSIKKSLKLYPHFDKGWLMYAALKEQVGLLKDAIHGYNTFLQKTAMPNFNIQRYLTNLVFKQKTLEQQTNTLLTDKTDFEQALILFKHKQFDHALNKIDNCITQEPNNIEAHLLKVQIYTSMHDYKTAAKHIACCALNEPNNDTWYEALHLLCRSGLPYKKAINLLADITKKHPTELNPHVYLIDLLTRNQQFDLAIVENERAIEQCTDNTMCKRLNYHMALLCYQQKKFPAMIKALESCTALDQNFLPALNLHAYYLATKGKNLKQAKKIIATVLKKDPHNPHYLDTHAVILYKEKKYAQAGQILKKLIDQIPHDATIMKHLAKVQFKLGDKEQARTTLDCATKYATVFEKKECESLLTRWHL